MRSRKLGIFLILAGLMCLSALPASAQSFRVQCPTSTITHPVAANNNSEPAYAGPTAFTAGGNGYLTPSANVNGAIKCQQISGGDGYSTMGDGTQTYMFSFGPLSGLADMAAGRPGTEYPGIFNAQYPGSTPLRPGDPATTDDAGGAFTFNGAIGMVNDIANLVSIYDIAQDPTQSGTPHRVTVQTNSPLGVKAGDSVVIAGTGLAYDGTWTVAAIGLPSPLPTLEQNLNRQGDFYESQNCAHSRNFSTSAMTLPDSFLMSTVNVRSILSCGFGACLIRGPVLRTAEYVPKLFRFPAF